MFAHRDHDLHDSKHASTPNVALRAIDAIMPEKDLSSDLSSDRRCAKISVWTFGIKLRPFHRAFSPTVHHIMLVRSSTNPS